jgi:hypothetical protein
LDGKPTLPDFSAYTAEYPQQYAMWFIHVVESWRPGCMNLLDQPECAIGGIWSFPLRDHAKMVAYLAAIGHTQGSIWLSPVPMYVIPQEGLTQFEQEMFAYGHAPVFVSERFPWPSVCPIYDSGGFHLMATYTYNWGTMAGQPDPLSWADTVVNLTSCQEVADLQWKGKDGMIAPLRFAVWAVEPAPLNPAYTVAADSHQVTGLADLLSRMPDLSLLEIDLELYLVPEPSSDGIEIPVVGSAAAEAPAADAPVSATPTPNPGGTSADPANEAGDGEQASLPVEDGDTTLVSYLGGGINQSAASAAAVVEEAPATIATAPEAAWVSVMSYWDVAALAACMAGLEFKVDGAPVLDCAAVRAGRYAVNTMLVWPVALAGLALVGFGVLSLRRRRTSLAKARK